MVPKNQFSTVFIHLMVQHTPGSSNCWLDVAFARMYIHLSISSFDKADEDSGTAMALNNTTISTESRIYVAEGGSCTL